MSNSIEIKELSFGYDDNKIYDNFSMNIKEKSITHIIDCENNGKTTLAKIISCELKFNALIKINGNVLTQNNILKLKKDIVTLYENPNNIFVSDTVRKCISIVLKSKKLDEKNFDKEIEKVSKLLNIYNLLERNPLNLSGGEQQLVALLIGLIQKPKILIIDNAMDMIDSTRKKIVYKLLENLRKEGSTIVHFTTNSEDLLLGTNIIIINNGKVILDKSVKKAFSNLDIYKDNNIALPFIVELSSKLMYYKTIDKIYFDYKKLVNDLWN